MSAARSLGQNSMLGMVRSADGGTLFLDEVAEIPLNVQPKLLRVIQQQEVMPVGHPIPVKINTRFIAGTNRNLREMVNREVSAGSLLSAEYRAGCGSASARAI